MLILLVEAEGKGAGALAVSLAQEPDVELETLNHEPAAVDRISARPFDAVVLDLPGGYPDCVGLVRRIRQRLPAVPLVVTTPDATVDRAVACMRAGVTDFLPQPVDAGALAARLRRALREAPFRDPPTRAVARAAGSANEHIIGEHPRLDAVRGFAERLARVRDAAVLISGEPGTGKRHLASTIHTLSGVRGRFVEAPCATLVPAQAEAELFGSERGPLGNDKSSRHGLLEAAAGGTLFLAELCSLPLGAQARLLAFLETRRLRRLGGTDWLPLAVRVIAATAEDPSQAVRNGRLRPDLLHRLVPRSIHLPSLREMPELAPQLAAHFSAELAAAHGQPRPVLDAAGLTTLTGYDWPGNMLELRAAVERAMALCTGGPLVLSPPRATAPHVENAVGVIMPPGLTLEEVERRYLLAALQDFKGDYTTLAERLGISRKTLWDRRRRLGLGTQGGDEVGTRRSEREPRRDHARDLVQKV